MSQEKFTLQLRLIAFSLLVKDVDLDGQISIIDSLSLQIVENVEQLQADEFVADADAILELWRWYDNAIDEGHQSCFVFNTGRIFQFSNDNTESITVTYVITLNSRN